MIGIKMTIIIIIITMVADNDAEDEDAKER